MTKKQKVVFAVVAAVFAVVAAVLVLGIILSYVCYHFIYGTRITSREGEAYHKLEGKGVYSPLAVFPSVDMDTVSQDFYRQIFFCLLHRLFHSCTFCKIRGDRTGKSTTGSVGIGIFHPLTTDPDFFLPRTEEIICIVDPMTTFQ